MPTPITWPLIPNPADPDLVPPTPGVLTQITDLVARGRNRVLVQYRGLTRRFLPLLDVLTGNVQELENAVWGFITEFDIANANDTWLDRLGSIVGEAREGENDTVYRRLIQARVLANRSNGTDEDVIAVFLKVLNNPMGIALAIRDCQPASIEIIVTGYIFDITNPDVMRLKKRLKKMLQITRGAGVKLMVIGTPVDPATTFRFSSTPHPVLSDRGFADATDPGHFRITGGRFRTAFVA